MSGRAFDGTGDYGETGGHNDHNAQIMSVFIWAYIPSGHGNAQYTRLAECGGYNIGGGWAFEFTSTTALKALIWRNPGTGGGDLSNIGSAYTFPTDQWFSLCLTSRTQSGGEEHKFYAAASQQGSTDTTNQRDYNGTRDICFAAANNDKSGDAELTLGWVSIYNVILTANQVTQLNRGASPYHVSTGNLKRLWRMGDGKDVSGNGYNITYTNSTVADGPPVAPVWPNRQNWSVPTAGGGVTIGVPAGVLGLAGFAPTVTASDHKVVNVPAGAINPVGQVPTILTPNTISIPLANLGLTGLSPAANVTEHKTVSPPAAVLTLTGLAPAANASDHKTVDVPAASLGLAGNAPTINVSGDKVVNVPVANLTLTGYVAGIQTPNTINIPSASLTLTGLAPDAKTPVTINVPVGSLTLSGLQPSANISNNVFVQIPLGNLALTGFEPSVGQSALVGVPVGVLNLVGLAPVVIGAQQVGFLTATFTLDPAIKGSITLDPALSSDDITSDPSIDGSITVD